MGADTQNKLGKKKNVNNLYFSSKMIKAYEMEKQKEIDEIETLAGFKKT